MKKILFILFGLALSFTYFACDNDDDDDNNNNNNTPSWEILEYGRPTCGYCMGLKADLEAEPLPFIFFNIDTNSTASSEMWDKLHAIGHTGSVDLPVVDVIVDDSSHIMIRPSIEDIKNLLP